MPTASPTAARESSMSSFLFLFVCLFTELFPLRDLGGEMPAPQCSIHGGSLHTLAILPTVVYVHIYPALVLIFVPSNNVTRVNSSILCKQKNKNTITNCYFSSSPLVQLSQARVSVGTMENWVNLRKKIEQVETDTSDMEPHWTLGELWHIWDSCVPLLLSPVTVPVALPALSRPRLMILMLCNLTSQFTISVTWGCFCRPLLVITEEVTITLTMLLLSPVFFFFCKRLSQN